MDPVLIWPEHPSVEVVRSLGFAGVHTKYLDRDYLLGEQEWAGAVVDASGDPEGALAWCRKLKRGDVRIGRVLVIVSAMHLAALMDHVDLFDDFILAPFHPLEMELRARQLVRQEAVNGTDASVVAYGPLTLNVETYQASVEGRPLDLTYMEYELLKHLASSPGRVHTRESLLQQVWGYEYYGGARTVDVHVRRLRAKLGEDHAALISTVRSVGYRFGESRFDVGSEG